MMTETAQNLLPHSPEAEIGVLGSCIHNPDALSEIRTVLIDSSVFYSPAHRVVYESILRLADAETPFDEITILRDIEKHGQVATIGGGYFIVELVDLTPVVANFMAYAKIVAECAAKRAVFRAVEEIGSDMRGDGKKAREAITEAIIRFEGISQEATTPQSINASDAAQSFFDWVDKISKGTVEGMPIKLGNHFDSMVGGLRPGQLHIIAARPKVGKTIMALNCAQHNAILGHKVLYFSLEMSAADMTGRMVSSVSKVDGSLLMSGRVNDFDEHQWDKIAQASAAISALPLKFIEGEGGRTVSEVIALYKLAVQKEDVKLIVIDHLGLVDAPGDKEQERQKYRIDSFRKLAEKVKIPVLVTAQINRAGNDRPELKHLEWSAAIEQNCYTAFLLHRSDEDNAAEVVECNLAAHRNGPTGLLKLEADLKHFRIGPRVIDTNNPKFTYD